MQPDFYHSLVNLGKTYVVRDRQTARVVIEAGVTASWWRYAGPSGRIIGLDRFGESAPAEELFEHFGFSTSNVVAVAKNVLK